MIKILVIGSNGFIGKNLLRKLSQYDVVSLGRNDLDITDLTSVKAQFEAVKPNIIINLAADKSRGSTYNDFLNAVNINLIGTLNIVEASKSTSSLKHLIFLGTCEEYGSSAEPFEESQKEAPVSAYSFSKACSKVLLETLNRQADLPFTYIRPTLVYGPHQGEEMFLPALIKSLKDKKRFPLTKGEQLRDYVHVDDLSDAIVKIIEKGSVTFGQVYNIGSGEEISIKDLALKVANLLSAVEFLDLGALPYRNAEIFNYRCSINKVSNNINWSPKISMDQGLKGLIS